MSRIPTSRLLSSRRAPTRCSARRTWSCRRRASCSGRLFPAEHKADVEAYQAETAKKSDLERTDLAKDKSGVFTGAHAINPANGRASADLDGGLRLGRLRDRRDHGGAGARLARLGVRTEIQAADQCRCAGTGRRGESIGFTGSGTAVNSDFLDGLPTPEAKRHDHRLARGEGAWPWDDQLQAT